MRLGGEAVRLGMTLAVTVPAPRLPAVGCDHVPVTEFAVRPAQPGDARAMAELMAAVAAERDGIAAEPPVDIGERAALFARSASGSVVAVAEGQIIGMLHIEASRHGAEDVRAPRGVAEALHAGHMRQAQPRLDCREVVLGHGAQGQRPVTRVGH